MESLIFFSKQVPGANKVKKKEKKQGNDLHCSQIVFLVPRRPRVPS